MDKGDVLLHPVRMRIIMALASRPGLTVYEIGQLMPDTPQATLYRHIKILDEAGIVQVIEERPTGGSLERVFTLVEGSSILTNEDLETVTREDHMRYFILYCVNLMRLYGTYLSRDKIDLLADGVGFRTLSLNMTDDDLEAFRRSLASLVQTYSNNGPSPERKRHTFSVISLPDVDLDSE